MENLIPNSYVLGYGATGLFVINIMSRKYDAQCKPISWSISEGSDKSMSKEDGNFYYESLPSSRDEQYFAIFRFSSVEEAYECYKKFHPSK